MPIDPQQKQEVVQRSSSSLKRLWSFRRQYDTRRSYFYRQYIGSRDQSFFPDNVTKRANTFVMYPFSNVETVVSRTTDAFFSFPDWFECTGRGMADGDAAEKMQLVLETKLRQAKLIPAIEELIRNICIYGHAGIKVDWDWDYDLVPFMAPVYAMGPDGQPVMAPVQDPNTGQVMAAPVQTGTQLQYKPVRKARPRFIPIDIYDMLVDPDGGMAAHLCERTFGQMKREAQAYAEANPGKELYYADSLAEIEATLADEKEKDDIIVRFAELWNHQDNTCTILTFSDDASTSLALKDAREAMRGGAAKTTWQRKVYGGKPVLLWMGENPFGHRKVPILHTSYVKLPNQIYGVGVIESISDLTESLNRFVNMVTDNWNLGINRRYAYDINADIDHAALNNMNVPGGKVAVNGDPSKVVAPLPFFTPSSNDYTILDLYRGMIEMSSGVSDFYAKGTGSSGGNDTATGISQIINESNYRFKMFIRNIEVDILQPLLEMCASMIQQFMTDEEEFQITDEQPGIPKFQTVTPEELVGVLDFNIVAANYAMGKVVRQRNLMALVNVIGASPFWNQYEGLKEICKVFEIPNYQRLLKTPEQVQMEQQAAKQEQIQMMIFETMLQTESKARLAQSKPSPGQGKGGGRPAKAQFEGKIPGAGLSSSIREFAQGMGANALGLEGLGQIPGA